MEPLDSFVDVLTMFDKAFGRVNEIRMSLELWYTSLCVTQARERVDDVCEANKKRMNRNENDKITEFSLGYAVKCSDKDSSVCYQCLTSSTAFVHCG